MSLRERFEKLFPVPEGVVFEDDAYYSKDYNFYVQAENDAQAQNTLWIGFQAGHAAGLERACDFCEGMGHEHLAAAIRAMKP